MLRLISQFTVELISCLRLGIKRLRVPLLIALTSFLGCFALALGGLSIFIGDDCLTKGQRSCCLGRIGAIPFTLFLPLYPVHCIVVASIKRVPKLRYAYILSVPLKIYEYF
ncbi:hypothetical protein CXQ80_10955 [Pseudomonas sp. 02C 26]|nr:hypothetical protein CXQ80_10955 [Pseudomonas sp. 02C 26]